MRHVRILKDEELESITAGAAAPWFNFAFQWGANLGNIATAKLNTTFQVVPTQTVANFQTAAAALLGFLGIQI